MISSAQSVYGRKPASASGYFRTVLITCLAIPGLVACGGGSGGGDNSSPDTTVSASTDTPFLNGKREATVKATTNASNPTYAWTVESRPEGSYLHNGAISNSDKAEANFTTDAVGSYELKVTVNGNVSDTVTLEADNIWRPLAVDDLPDGAVSYGFSLATAPSGEPYVGHQGNVGTANNGLTTLNFNDISWKDVGGNNYAHLDLSLAIHPDGTPYRAYSDISTNGAVQKFDGTSWVLVGSDSLNADEASHISLDIAPDGTLYLAYHDTGDDNKVVVQMFDGTTWSKVGGSTASTGNARFAALAVASDGSPYIAFSDSLNANKATVKKYDGSNWVNIGIAGFSPSEAEYLSLALSPVDDTPYLAYVDANEKKGVVARYQGTSWSRVGGGYLPNSRITRELALAVTQDGLPMVAFSDGSANVDFKARVMLYDGTAWNNLGESGFSSDTVSFVRLALLPDDTPLIAYAVSTSGQSNKMFVRKLSTLAPQVTRILPGRGQSQVDKSTKLTVRFDREMDETTTINSSNYVIRDNSGIVNINSIQSGVGSMTVELEPGRDLVGEVTVTLEEDEIQDVDGKKFKGMSWHFCISC
ncbi:Ig-like domain-containing protein [uncultured Marinobacter sp.]|uniref:Ig-like domain-containing protein n=1 Tax=uncultured Marinobacter sp. TaxID=187379 RepID=UPI0026173300|nr:Ig-like domain-containing protein [uncultured Marinobacter sp.]